MTVFKAKSSRPNYLFQVQKYCSFICGSERLTITNSSYLTKAFFKKKKSISKFTHLTFIKSHLECLKQSDFWVKRNIPEKKKISLNWLFLFNYELLFDLRKILTISDLTTYKHWDKPLQNMITVREFFFQSMENIKIECNFDDRKPVII